MSTISDKIFSESTSWPRGVRLLKPFGSRKITHAFHDIDGTHSLIRDWVPAMTLLLGWVSSNGLPENMESDKTMTSILACNWKDFEEAHRFSVESAGLSALTQMEWALRRAIQNGTLTDAGDIQNKNNDRIVELIWNGEEIFEELTETPQMRDFINKKSSELFRLYEKMLMRMCRDENIESARKNPKAWRVKGSIEFLNLLHQYGIKNYFVTGAVVEHDADANSHGSMYEEVKALGYEIGAGLSIENIYGSSWSRKQPKIDIMRQICKQGNINPEEVLIVGDGRSEITAGVQMGAVTISRLPVDAAIHRKLHQKLGTNMILPDYSFSGFKQMFCKNF